MTRHILYSVRAEGTPIGARKPDRANVSWTGISLDNLGALEFWLESESVYSNVGYPARVRVVDGMLYGDESTADPTEPVVAHFIDEKRSSGGDLLVEKVSDTSLKVWFDTIKKKPGRVLRIVGIPGGAQDFYARRGLPTPTAEWLDKTVINTVDRKVYLCQDEGFRTTHPVSTFESLAGYMTSGDADLTIIHHLFPDAAAANEGKYYYDTYDNTFWQLYQFSPGNYDYRQVGAGRALVEVCHAYWAANEGGELPGDDNTRVIYLGEGHDDDNVTEVILPQHTVDLTVEYYVYYNFITNDFEILTDYTPANGLIHNYVWNLARAEAVHPIIRPLAGGAFPQPTEELFQAHALLVDFAAHPWYLENSLRSGQSERAIFAPFESRPSAAAGVRGFEILTPWASGTDYKVGDRVSAGTGPASFTVCVQDHTSTVGGATGDPDDENTGYEAYWEAVEGYANRLSVPNRGHFRGVVGNVNQVSSPAVNDWIAAPHGNGVEFRMYEVRRGLFGAAAAWVTAHPFAHVLGAFQDEAAARRAIRSFDSGSRTVALINGQLRELTYYSGRTMDTHVLEWVASRPGGNPAAVFYGRSMSATGGRWQEAAAGNKEDEGTDDRLLRWHTEPRQSYFHGNAFGGAFEFHAPSAVTGEDATVTASDILFSPPPGLYHVELGAGHNQGGREQAALGLFQVLSGAADDQARALVTPGDSNVASILGEPDLEQAATARRRFLQVNDGDVFLAIYKGANGNTSQYMLWEKLD